MQDIISKLVSAMRLRLKGKGGGPKPGAQEIKSWGAKQLHWGLPILLSVLLGILLVGGMGALLTLGLVEPLIAGVLSVVAVAGGTLLAPLTLILLYVWRSKHNRKLALNAYRKLLERNERFALVEYARYLKRRIKQARTQGVPAGQIERLSQAYAQLKELIKQGAGAAGEAAAPASGGQPDKTSIEEEAQLAESIAEVYDFAVNAGSLKLLDQQLAPEIRDRVAQLERELEAGEFGELRQASDLSEDDARQAGTGELE